MTDNIYFLFLDELYTPNLNEFKKCSKEEIFNKENHWHFGLTGSIITASSLYNLYAKARKIKNKYYPEINNLIFHYVDTLNKKDEFSDLKIDNKKYKAYTESLINFVSNTDFKYVCSFVDKHELIKQYGIFDKTGTIRKINKIGSNMFPKSQFLNYNLYLLCLKSIIIDFYKFITNRANPARGIIVAEARGEREDAELREAFHKIYYDGISSIKPTELRSIILDLLIVPKKQNYIGTQLADMIIYPTYDALISNHNPRIDHFIDFNRCLKKKILKDCCKVIP